MSRTFLIATVAALAITAPAQAERGGRGQDGERPQKAQAQTQDGERAQKAQAQPQEGRQRGRGNADRGEARTQVRAQASQRFERAFEPRVRAQERAVERRSAPRMEVRQQAPERRVRAVEIRQARPQFERREARPQVERRARAVENRGRVQEHNTQRAFARERVAPQHLRQDERRSERLTTQRVRQQDNRRDQRFATQRLRQQDDRQSERFSRMQDRGAARAEPLQVQTTQRAEAWQTYAGRAARFDRDRRDRPARQRMVTVGQRLNPDWYDNYAPVRYRAFYDNTPDQYYRYDYDDGYLYQVSRDSNLVTGLFPLLGGAYSVGQPLPYYQQSYYNVPLGYRSLYYDTPDQYYRFGDGAIYQVDPGTQLIQGIVALLSGQSFGIGQQLPMGYDVYNVPYAYRSDYYDTPDTWYRYDDGYIYGVDPRTRMIQSMYPTYGGYSVGYPAPAAYAGYDYNVPYGYRDLYYDQPGYDYRYADGGIYQVDPSSQLVAALVALVTGQNFGVGQQLPLGYDAYNVPYAYRDRYYDTDQYNYRYADGHIYQVDPQTRMIQSVIDAIV